VQRRSMSILAVVVVIGAMLVGALAATTVTGPSAAKPTPAAPQSSGLPAGTYSTQRFSPGATFTLPSGWDITADESNYLELRPAGSDIAGIHFFRDPLPRSQELSCPEAAASGVGTTSIDVVRWLRSLPGLVVSDPRIVSVGGLRGTEIDVGIREGWTASCPFANGAPTVPLWLDGKGGYQWVAAGSERLRLALLDAPGGGTVIVDIDAFDGSVMDQLIADATPIVASLVFDTTAPSPLVVPSASPAASSTPASPVASSAASPAASPSAAPALSPSP
jgi:hypothetical protein